MEIKYIVIHHSAVSREKNSDQFEANNNYHKSKGFPKSSFGYYLGYHYEISPSGKLRYARAEGEMGAHTVGLNECSIGVCLDGNFDIELPTKEQEEQLRMLLFEFKNNYPKAKIVYHRQFAIKTCPGKLIPDDWAINLINNKEMTNVKLVRNGNEWGFFVPANNEVSLIDKGMNFGIEIPTAGENKVDWKKLEEIGAGSVTLN
jgi:hypothetical protein